MTPALAAELLDDLHANRIEVVLTPSRRREEAIRGGMIRTVVSYNPRWYRRLCDAHAKTRRRPRKSMKADTRIVRRDVAARLSTVVAGKKSKSYIIQWLADNINPAEVCYAPPETDTTRAEEPPEPATETVPPDYYDDDCPF